MFDSQRAPMVSDAVRLLDWVPAVDSWCMSLLTSCQCFAKGVQREDVRMQLDSTQPSSKGLVSHCSPTFPFIDSTKQFVCDRSCPLMQEHTLPNLRHTTCCIVRLFCFLISCIVLAQKLFLDRTVLLKKIYLALICMHNIN